MSTLEQIQAANIARLCAWLVDDAADYACPVWAANPSVHGRLAGEILRRAHQLADEGVSETHVRQLIALGLRAGGAR